MKAVAGVVQMWNEQTTVLLVCTSLFHSVRLLQSRPWEEDGGGDPGVEPNKREALIK